MNAVADAAAALSTSMQTFAPNPANRAIYRRTSDVFRRTRDALRPVWPELRELRRQTQAEA